MVLAALIFLSLPPGVYSENLFKPWGASVKVGDEMKKVVRVIPAKGSEGARRNKRRVRPVYNGVQGGAFFLIRFFQIAISSQDGPNCRYIPTCSAYGRIAVEKHGALMGAILAGERLIRCNPYNAPGYDRVPDKIFGGR